MEDPMDDPMAALGRLTDLATPFAVRTVATLGLADLIAGGVGDLDTLAERAGVDRDALGRLLRYLVHRDVFTETAPNVFALTPVGRLLCDDGAAGQRRWLDLTGLGARMDLAYQGLPHAVRTGQPAYAQVHGRDFWAELDARPDFRTYFDELMYTQQRLTAPQVAAGYDWSGVSRVVDVGAGSGELLVELLTRHQHLHGTYLDRPGPAAAARTRFAAAELADRVEVVAGDFFAPLPAGGDVYVVSRAITDWADREAVAILARCATAAGPTGRVLIVEVLPTEPHVPHRSPFDLQMLVLVGGRERTLADFADLAGRAGLRVTGVCHGERGLVLIECAVGADDGAAPGLPGAA
jgi:hypothetical protein